MRTDYTCGPLLSKVSAMIRPTRRFSVFAVGLTLLMWRLTLAGYGAGADSAAVSAALPPQPGEVYREFMAHADGNIDWRVTNPNNRGERPREFLPNPILDLEISDLADVVRAEVVVDCWGGHCGTIGKRISFNGKKWVMLREIQNTPPGLRPENFMYQHNPVVRVPLAFLKQGANTFEGTCDILGYNGWGQWGMYSINTRVYYDPGKKPHTRARIVSPAPGAAFGDNPIIEIEPDNDDVQRIDVLAYCEDLDYDGDGVYTEWKESWFQPERGESAVIAHHVGSITKAPFRLSWDTGWLPDQEPGTVRLIARVQDNDGVWSVTEPVEGLTLKRDNGYSVRLLKAHDVPIKFGTRVGRKLSCKIAVPEDVDLSGARDARLHVRTWNGLNKQHGDFTFNDAVMKGKGLNHHFAQRFHTIPLDAIRTGDNVVSFLSQTEHHHLEVLWPGPSLLVRMGKLRR